MVRKADGFQSEKIVVLPPYILNEIILHPLISPLFITDIGYYPRAMNHFRERKEGCDSHILIYCIGGEGTVTIDQKQPLRLTERTMVILPAGIPHCYGADLNDPWSIFWFHLSGDASAAFLHSLNLLDNPMQLSAGDEEKFVTLFHQCYDILLTKPYSIPHHVHVSQTVRYLLSLLGLNPSRKQEERQQQYIEQAIQYMREQLAQSLTLEELTTHTQVSKQHLNALFKLSTGFAPIDYYHRMKIQRAAQLLDLTELSIKEICHSLGFKDPYYFSRMFKKIIGVSPSRYRSQLKG
ncbi:MAG: AraC family transcriptional regulator [Candidatus Cohnella colombiensis]|uniref:AraC family transcriptional regulator n=1 Tax=Candidatus Cohnella colombiensis TaxID=3121368 RepID=A0AA95EWF0_9BACL|nr:MAG: AraC family transcriptional regulator [Cohnella sp.]